MTNTYFLAFGVYTSAISGVEAAYAAFENACDFAERFREDILVTLVDATTGEVLADNWDD